MKNTKRISYLGLLIAVIVVMSIVPQIGFIQIPPLSLTIVHIPVIIGAILLKGNASFILSTAFGLASWFVAMTRGANSDVLFMNPLISVLPRVLFGIVLYFIVRAIDNTSLSTMVKTGIAAFIGSLVHSVFVLGAILIFLGISSHNLFTFENFSALITGILVLNVLVESIASVIISIPVVKASKKVID